MRGETMVVGVEMATITCCAVGCGIVFAVPEWWQAKRREDHTTWYCPNGHPQGYLAKTEAEKLREQLDKSERSLNRERDRRQRAEESAMNLANSRRALRGVVTKLKRKAQAGTCAWCDHQVPDLAAHVAAEHPGVSVEAEAADEEPGDAG